MIITSCSCFNVFSARWVIRCEVQLERSKKAFGFVFNPSKAWNNFKFKQQHPSSFMNSMRGFMATPFIDQNLICRCNPKLQLDTSVHVLLQCKFYLGSVLFGCRLTCSQHQSGCPPQRCRAEHKVLVLWSWPAPLPLQEITVWAQFCSLKCKPRGPTGSRAAAYHARRLGRPSEPPLSWRFFCCQRFEDALTQLLGRVCTDTQSASPSWWECKTGHDKTQKWPKKRVL